MERLLVGDIGGTNCRLALADPAGPAGEFEAQVRFSVSDFASAEAAIAAFLEPCGAFTILGAALGIAGPVDGDTAALTNGFWRFGAKALQRRFGFPVRLLNDLAAQGHALAEGSPEGFETIGPAMAPARAVLTIVSPGTGLGVGLVSMDAPSRILATEGGHVGFAPSDAIERDLARVWSAELGRVSWEHVLSGPGLARLHAGLGGDPARAGPEIMRLGLSGQDPIALETLQRFAALLGDACGDYARAHGAGAVTLTGAIARDLAPILRQGGFRARFEAGGPSGDYMRAIPTRLAMRAELGLIGAHAALLRL